MKLLYGTAATIVKLDTGKCRYLFYEHHIANHSRFAFSVVEHEAAAHEPVASARYLPPLSTQLQLYDVNEGWANQTNFQYILGNQGNNHTSFTVILR